MQEEGALVRLSGGGIGWNTATPQIIGNTPFSGEWTTWEP